MQHLNDDMDEIFRKAADEYPLNTGTADWNKVAERLSQDIIPEPPVKKSYRKYRWLLLLLPLGFICNQIYDPGLFKQIINNNEVAENTKNSKEQPNLKDREPGSGDQASALDNKEPGTNKNLDSDKNSDSDMNSDPGKNSDSDKNLDSEKNSGSDKNLVSDSKKLSDQSSKSEKMTAGQLNLSDKQTSNKDNATSRKNKTPGINHNPKTSNPKSSGKAYGGIAINSTVEESPVPDFYEIDPYTKTGLALFDNAPDVSAIPLPEMTKLTPGPLSKQRAKQKNFYVGLVGGIDMTTISFQETSKIGNQYGGLAGYSFAKKWSVEVGFFC